MVNRFRFLNSRRRISKRHITLFTLILKIVIKSNTLRKSKFEFTSNEYER